MINPKAHFTSFLFKILLLRISRSIFVLLLSRQRKLVAQWEPFRALPQKSEKVAEGAAAKGAMSGGCCDAIERAVDESVCVRNHLPILNRYIRTLGSILVFVVYCITALLTFTSFAIILPYEQLYQPALLLLFYATVGVFLLANIMFHYYKARTLQPIYVPGTPNDRWCVRCEHWKSARTHHCSICQRCVLGMDHHCIWINQCVGSHNHRHFFLFIANLTLASLVIVLAGFNSAWDHFFDHRQGHHFCSVMLTLAPLQNFICSYDGFARNSVIFSYLLSALLLALVGFLTLWNAFLVSKGFTYIDYLQHSDIVAVNPNYRNPLNRGFHSNWRAFLGMRRHRSFFSQVILPSSHAPMLYEDEAAAMRASQEIV